ncbi:hypothetical protein C367_03369 [Cryptococcus neoformans Ze90-1]|nr:hypothetical protein C367_03369 [Cryptococcus neoformans var. grubii Ze90-1]
MSTTDTDYQSFSKVVILTEIMDPVTLTDGSTTDDKANYKRSRQAYALILKSLSLEVQSLSRACTK